MGRKANYKFRDPEPVTRDPVPVPTVHVNPVACPHCGNIGRWRQGGTTTPNPLSKQMVRWRQCLKCGRSHNQIWPMTESEVAKYCCPEHVMNVG
jgi:hypothetical protein